MKNTKIVDGRQKQPLRRRRRRRRRRLRKLPVLILTGLLILIVFGIVTLMKSISPTREKADLEELYGAGDGYASIITDHQWSESKALWQDDRAYLSIQTLNDEVKTRFFWDAQEHKLLYSLPDETLTCDANSEYEGAPVFIEQDDTAYISLEYVKQYANITASTFTDPARVVIQTKFGEARQATIKSKTYIRVKGGIKSPVITDVKKGSTVTVLEAMDKWSKVQTESGWIGYLEKSILEAEQTVTEEAPDVEPEYTSIYLDQPVSLLWQQSLNASCIRMLEPMIQTDAMSTINTVSPTWFSITSAEGDISSRASTDYVKLAHENGLKVWAVLENVNNKDVDMLALLNSTASRNKLVETVMNEILSSGADGLNLDIESLKSEMAAGYLQLIREFSIQCRKNSIVLSVDNYVPGGWNSFYNLKEQGAVVDYVIIMAYDEHYGGSDDMGSTSSISYVEKALKDTYEDVPAEKVICGIPFYSRLWKETNGSITSEAIGMDGMQDFISSHNAQVTWNEDLGQNVVELTEGDTTYHLWVEDAKSCETRVELIHSMETAGIACWKHGMQTSDVWAILAKYYPSGK